MIPGQETSLPPKAPCNISMIAIIDYGMGNLRSVSKAFEACGAKPLVTSSAEKILKAEKIVLPGVGAFGAAMRELKKRNLVHVIKEKIYRGTPYLGLCLGLQLLFSESEEKDERGRNPKGLDVLKGVVRRFKGPLKIPHMGWNTVRLLNRDNPLFKAVPDQSYFYFVHSYYAVPKDKRWASSVTPYGVSFCSSIRKGSLFATQFHPEKSQSAGMLIIKNFIQLGED